MDGYRRTWWQAWLWWAVAGVCLAMLTRSPTGALAWSAAAVLLSWVGIILLRRRPESSLNRPGVPETPRLALTVGLGLVGYPVAADVVPALGVWVPLLLIAVGPPVAAGLARRLPHSGFTSGGPDYFLARDGLNGDG